MTRRKAPRGRKPKRMSAETAATIVNDIHEDTAQRWSRKQIAEACSYFACEASRLASDVWLLKTEAKLAELTRLMNEPHPSRRRAKQRRGT